ncbi:MAG: NADPH:quinone oxidoreductase family protein [Holophagales bacterium]|nr:NADPH:quinone oxidoreductase family protein [Holophagales bacterium]
MRAVICDAYGDLDNLRLGDMEDPVPGPGEVVVDVHAAGVNFPDLLLVRGQYQARPDPPFVPGGECSGTIAAVGEGVDAGLLGREVIAMGMTGAFAEKMKVEAAAIAPVPPGLGLDQAAGVAITYGTSLYALAQRAGLEKGETLLVLGAGGGVGTAAVQIGKALGATVIAAASSPAKLDTAREAGADHLVNYSEEPLKNRVKELTAGRGADVIYDPVGGELTELAFRAIAWNGRHLVIGFAAGEIPKLPANLPLLKGASLVGVFWGSWTQRDPEGSAANFARLGRWLADGTLEPEVTPYPVERFAEALAEIDERRVRGKIVLRMDP